MISFSLEYNYVCYVEKKTKTLILIYEQLICTYMNERLRLNIVPMYMKYTQICMYDTMSYKYEQQVFQKII